MLSNEELTSLQRSLCNQSIRLRVLPQILDAAHEQITELRNELHRVKRDRDRWRRAFNVQLEREGEDDSS